MTGRLSGYLREVHRISQPVIGSAYRLGTANTVRGVRRVDYQFPEGSTGHLYLDHWDAVRQSRWWGVAGRQ